LKDKDIETSKQMVKIDKLSMIKNEFRKLNMTDEESDQNATMNMSATINMTATGMSTNQNKNTESLVQNNFLYYKMCHNLIDKFNKSSGDTVVENAVKNTYTSFGEIYEEYKKLHKYLENPLRDTKGEVKEWTSQLEMLIDDKIDSNDELIDEVKENSEDMIKDYRKTLYDKKQKDLSIDFKATGNESLINSYREMEEEDDKKDDQEKSF